MKYFKDRINIMSLRLSDDELRKLKEIRLYYNFRSNTRAIISCINYSYRSMKRQEVGYYEN